MSMILRRSMMIPKVEESGLPADYLAVEYLESTGTQCIDSGYIPTSDTNISMQKGATSGNIYNVYFGAGAGSANQVSISATYFNFFGSTNNSVPNNAQNTACLLEIKNKILYVDNVALVDKTIQTGSGSTNLAIFCRTTNAGDYERFSSMKLYSFKMWEGNTPVRDMIPCIRKSDSKPGMYDLVGRTFYTNAGTGEFLYPAMLKVAEYDKYCGRSAEGISDGTGWCYTDWYLFDPQPSGSSIKLRNNSTNNNHTYQYQNEDGTKKDYFYSNQTVGWSGVSMYKIRFSLQTADADDSYAYCLSTGQIFFAGKNTDYFGYSNINNIPT